MVGACRRVHLEGHAGHAAPLQDSAEQHSTSTAKVSYSSFPSLHFQAQNADCLT
jgi:hypothetical protein